MMNASLASRLQSCCHTLQRGFTPSTSSTSAWPTAGTTSCVNRSGGCAFLSAHRSRPVVAACSPGAAASSTRALRGFTTTRCTSSAGAHAHQDGRYTAVFATSRSDGRYGIRAAGVLPYNAQARENVLLVSTTAGAEDHQLRQVHARRLEGRAARFFSSSAGAASTGPPAPPSRVPPTTSDSDPEDEGREDHPDPPTPLEKIARPTFTQKRVYALQCAVPMIGFGVMDNLIMIQAGDLIDCTLGATFGLATITAAAMGQICSDTSGVCFGGFVDAAFNKLGLPVSDLTPDQLALDSVRLVRTLAMALGVLSGCLLGMTSLLFMDLDKKERLKRQRALATIFSTLAEEGSDLCNVERCALYIVEEDQKHVWSAARKVRLNVHAKDIRKACVLEVKLAAIDNQVSIRLLADCLRKLSWKESDIAEAVPGNRHSVTVDEALHLMDNLSTHDEERVALTDGGTKHWVVHNKKVLNIKDIASDERFTHSEVRQAAIAAGVDKKWTLLLGPVFEAVDEGEVGTKTGQEGEGERKVIGLVEMVNRRDENGKQIPFSEDDEKLVSMLCGHCSTFISQATDD